MRATPSPSRHTTKAPTKSPSLKSSRALSLFIVHWYANYYSFVQLFLYVLGQKGGREKKRRRKKEKEKEEEEEEEEEELHTHKHAYIIFTHILYKLTYIHTNKLTHLQTHTHTYTHTHIAQTAPPANEVHRATSPHSAVAKR